MIAEICKRSILGIAIGGFIMFLALTLLMIFSIDASISEIWRHFFASLVVGIYFSSASLLYELENWSLLKQTIIHLVLSVVTFFLVFTYAGWIPFNVWSLVLALVIFIAIYLIIWIVMYRYYKKMEISMNESIEKR